MLTVTEVCNKCKVGEVYMCVEEVAGGHIFKKGARYPIIDTPVLGPGLATEHHSENRVSWAHTGSGSKFRKVK